MAEQMAERLQALKEKLAQADRERAAAEARVAEAQKRLKEVNDQILALGFKPEEAEAKLQQLEANLAKDLTALDAALEKELAAYRAMGV